MNGLKFSYLLFAILYFANQSFGQDNNTIYISVIDEQDIPIQDVNVYVQDSFIGITNAVGVIKISTLQKKINVTLKYLSYTSKDTLINTNDRNFKITIKLFPSTYQIDEISITPNVHITDLSNNNLIDLLLFQDKLLLVYRKSNLTHLKVFDSLGYYGNFTYQFRQSGVFQSVSKGFSENQFYLLGPKECIPFTIHAYISILIKEDQKIPREKFDKLYGGILLFKDSLIIKSEFKEFGNKAEIYSYNTNNFDRNLLLTIYDNNKAKEAKLNYNIVKSIYLRDLGNKDERAIDFGIERRDITKDPNWNGDIIDLYVHNSQMPYISSFQAATQGLKLGTKTYKDNLFVLDNVDLVLSRVNADIKKVDRKIFLPRDEKNEYKFIQSSQDLCIENRDNYFYIDDELITLDKIEFDDKNVFYPKSKILLGQKLFILGRKSVAEVGNQVFMFSLKQK